MEESAGLESLAEEKGKWSYGKEKAPVPDGNGPADDEGLESPGNTCVSWFCWSARVQKRR